MDVLSADLPQFLKLLFALGLVIGLMGGLTLILKKLGLTTETNIKTGNKRRLKIIESLPLDARRRLVIVQCDKAEYLLILGANSETIIDTDLSPVDDSLSEETST